jgi:predicted anti-sigma-YlaC factor YlaD
MKFLIPLDPADRLPLALVAAHGASDLTAPRRRLAAYVTLAAPLDDGTATACFAVASVAHFAQDVGVVASLALHAVVGACALVSYSVAFKVLLAYMLVLHIPLHLWRVRAQPRGTAGLVVIAAALVVARVALGDAGVFEFDEPLQRVVIAHALSVSNFTK